MKKTLIIHIGIQKTGTTYLQNILANNVNILKQQNILFPEHKFNNHGVSLYSMFERKPYNYHTNKMMGYKTKVDVDALNETYRHYWTEIFNTSKEDTIIISGEDLSVLSSHAVKKMFEFFNEFELDIKVVCYLRENDEWVDSMAQQYIKEGVYTIDQLKKLNLRVRYRSIIDKYLNIVGRENMYIRNFTDMRKNKKDIVVDFFELLDLNVDISNFNRESGTIENNDSLTLEQVLVFNRMNEMYPLHEVKRASLPTILEILPKISRNKFHLNTEYTETLKNRINIDIDYVNEIIRGNKLKSASFDSISSDINDDYIGIDYLVDVLRIASLEIDKGKQERFNLATEITQKNNTIQLMELIKNTLFAGVCNIENIEYIYIKPFDSSCEQLVKFNSEYGSINHVIGDLYEISFRADVDIIECYIQLALYLETVGDIQQAYKYMVIANMFKSNQPDIVQKCVEYSQYLNTHTKSLKTYQSNDLADLRNIRNISKELPTDFKPEDLTLLLDTKSSVDKLLSKECFKMIIYLIKGLIVFDKKYYIEQYSEMHSMVKEAPKKHFVSVGYIKQLSTNAKYDGGLRN